MSEQKSRALFFPTFPTCPSLHCRYHTQLSAEGSQRYNLRSGKECEIRNIFNDVLRKDAKRHGYLLWQG